jgi:hypothetical protein
MPKAIANIVSVSPYHNHSTGDLADTLGTLSAEIAELEDRADGRPLRKQCRASPTQVGDTARVRMVCWPLRRNEPAYLSVRSSLQRVHVCVGGTRRLGPQQRR